MRSKLYEYNGKDLLLSEIAAIEGINKKTLQDWIDKTNDIYKAVAGVKESLKSREIKYYEEILSLTAIAKKENIKRETLKKYYDITNDIYEAVRICKNSKEQRKGTILYKGKKRTIHAIAQLENIERHSLKRNYAKTNDIEIAVKLTKEAKEEHNGTIPYKGKLMTINGIASLEKIKKDTLRKYYNIYNNIEKAVLITKLGQDKRKESLLKNKKIKIEEASKELEISSIRLTKMLESGITLDEIEQKQKENNRGKKDRYIKINDETLFKYCLDNGLNYTVIYNMITKYNKTPKEALEAYLKNGQNIPHKWIYEKYEILLKHLYITFGIDSNRLIKTMRENNISIEQALEKIVFLSYNNSKFSNIEIEWLYELYKFLKECNSIEFEEAKKTFFITKKEIELLTEKQNKIKEIKRQILLYEFAEVLDTWDEKELIEMFELYNITEKDIETIILNLYLPYEFKVINPNEDTKKRKKFLNQVILNILNKTEISKLMYLDSLNLKEFEKEYINKKVEKLKIFKQEYNDKKIRLEL